MKTSERLLRSLRAAGLDLPEGTRLIRTYAGYWQRKQGSWSWQAIGPDGIPLCIGSHDRMTDLLRAPHWSIATEFGETDVSVQPEERAGQPRSWRVSTEVRVHRNRSGVSHEA